MGTTFEDKKEISAFIVANRKNFQDKLLSEAVNVGSKIDDILKKGNIDLLKNAEKLVVYIAESHEKELEEFAKIEGVAWAEHSLTLAFKLEWVQAIRRTLWHFLYEYDKMYETQTDREEFYELEKRINDNVDRFLNNFFISYSDFKDQQLLSQRKLVEHLSVPIIPISSMIAVLPLIGTIDSYRIQTIEEKILMNIASLKIQTLIIDMSGVAEMEIDIIVHLQRLLGGINMMGCEAVMTGLRVDLVRKMIHSGVSFEKDALTKGTLQQTLREYLVLEPCK
ncbi:STAS domain-containing protein [Rossellomorea oryzaecorticis]|uniref:STAS domain-containing protein n=1 Tax=Rossellomorea oryzaecorticis TaxID=1396505 RepID=A0ABW8VTF5_9BACI|nr:STAS domain-containing protein [[Bacillus] enclensis]MBH9965233.1 STAS domain-containing protein [[Bacillus] enclensis]QWC24710.1 STAS domain-containing protein [Bacillus haikouensis]